MRYWGPVRWLPLLMLACVSCAEAPPKNAVFACSGTLCPAGYVCREGYCFPLASGDGGCHAAACEENACGTVADACVGTIECGACPSPKTCVANVCTCTGETAAELCGTAVCGDVTKVDRCGASRTVSCGTCATGLCSAGACSGCAPESDGAFCARLGARCGQLVAKDNCSAVRTGKCGGCAGCEADGGACCLVRGQTCGTDAECCDGRSCFNGRCERLDGGN